MKFHLVIPAAGVGVRFGGEIPKQYIKISGQTILEWSLRPFVNCESIDRIVLAVGDNDAFIHSLDLPDNVEIVAGGQTRAHSVLSGLQHLENSGAVDDWVLVHDAARPCLPPENLHALIEYVSETNQPAILATPVTSTLKMMNGNRIAKTLPRDQFCAAQTPQASNISLLRRALETALSEGASITDEASALERLGDVTVTVVYGSSKNIKVTTQDDLLLAKGILDGQSDTA